jgi:hypothetical protein
MAGHARYTALLDACVLYPLAICDALMSVATTGLFAAKWSIEIEGEWISALQAKRPDLFGRLGYRRDQMRMAVPDWEVPPAAWRPLATSLQLPHAKDVHVLAAAIAGHADCIVTTNLKHFPRERADPYGIEVIHPDSFIVNQWDLNEFAVMSAFKEMRARWKKPQATAQDFAVAIERGGLPATAARLRNAAEMI